MGFLDKAKATAEQVAQKAKEGVEDVQLKRELGQAYGDLGKATFALLESGEISHASLEPAAAKIRELNAKAADLPEDAAAETTAPAAEDEQPAPTPTV